MIFRLVLVCQLRPRMVLDATSRGVTRNHVDMHGTPVALDSISSANCVMDLAHKVPSNKWRVVGVGSAQGVICVQARNSGETKQSEAPESNRTWVASDPMWRGKMK